MQTHLLAGLGLLLAQSAFAAEQIPFEISRACAEPYEKLERYWDTQRTLQLWSGMSDIMYACDLDPSQAATQIDITVDKAGLDLASGPTTPDGLSLLKNRLLRLSRQRLYLEAVLANGKKLKWKFTVSTGNENADGEANPKESNKTPVGYFELAKVNQQIQGSQQIRNSQAYCVQGAQYDYQGAPMPYAIFFKGGYAIHSGKVTGQPESHGCVRSDPQNARALYCLLRQPTAAASGARRSQGENWQVTRIKICEDLSKGCDLAGNITMPNAPDFE